MPLYAILPFLLDSIFFGFSVLTISLGVLSRIRKVKDHIPDVLMRKASTLLVRWAAVGYLLLAIYNVMWMWNDASASAQFAIMNRVMGPYWYLFWGPLVVFGVLPQLFWIRGMQDARKIQMAVGVILLVGLVLSQARLISPAIPNLQSVFSYTVFLSRYLGWIWLDALAGLAIFSIFLLAAMDILSRRTV